MAITRIPDRYKPGLNKIKSMDDAAFDELVSVLNACPVIAAVDKLRTRLAGEITRLNKAETSDVMRTLLSLMPSSSETDTPLQTTVSELIDAMQASSSPELRLTGNEEAIFRKRITTLLGIEPLSVSAKASLIRIEQQKILCDVKILSDMRPVFGNIRSNPVGWMINQTLKIEYHENGVHKDFYLTMDADDLQKLKSAIERAEIKSASMEEVLKKNNLPNLDEI